MTRELYRTRAMRPPTTIGGVPGRRDREGSGGAAAAAVANSAGGQRAPAEVPTGKKGMPGLAVLFLLSLLPQISFKIGPLLLKPYRVVLLALFLPLLFSLLSRRAGKMLAIDWLMIAAPAWATLALMTNYPMEAVVEPAGVIFLECLGAYLVARICIRSAEDFRQVVKVFFGIILFLLVFAAMESLTRRPILLELIGQGSAAVDTGIRFGLRRAQAVFAHPIHYGVFVAAALGMTWYALRPEASFVGRALCAMVIGLSTFFSLSTGALLSFVMQCVFIAWELATKPDPRRWRIFAWASLAGYIFLDLLSNRTPFHVLVDYATFSSGSAYNRILIWRYGTDNVMANPLFGIGFHEWERPSWMSSSVDNFWLALTMMYGLPFIAMFGGALLLIVRRVSWQNLPDAVDQACRAGYLTTVGGIALAGGTVHYWHTMFAFVVFIFGTGVWVISGGAKSASGSAALSAAPERFQVRYTGREKPARKRPVI